MKVLVVDSDISRVKAICKALRDRFRERPVVWMARNCPEAISILTRLKDMSWDLVFLDHDLEMNDQGGGKNGQAVAGAMRQIGVSAKRIVLQSQNVGGAEAMHGILHQHYQVLRAPFPKTLDVIEAMR